MLPPVPFPYITYQSRLVSNSKLNTCYIPIYTSINLLLLYSYPHLIFALGVSFKCMNAHDNNIERILDFFDSDQMKTCQYTARKIQGEI